MKIKRKKLSDNPDRVKGTVHGVWDKCLDCEKEIEVIRKFNGYVSKALACKYLTDRWENEGFIEWVCRRCSEYWFS